MKKNFWRNALILLLCLMLSGCTAGTPAAAEPTAAPTAEPTAEPTSEPTAAPTAAPTAEPTAAPTAEPEEISDGIGPSDGTGPSGGVTELQFEAMKPLFTAHILAQLNGMTYDQSSPEDIFTLGEYLGREQYGDRPLFYGQAYSSEPLYKKVGNEWRAVTKDKAPEY